MVEPFAIALHAIRRAPPVLNDAVVALGAEIIGLALVQALSHAGCGRLISVDIAEDRLEMAKKFGATHTINSGKQNPMEEILRLTHGLGKDLAFEAVGVTETVDLA